MEKIMVECDFISEVLTFLLDKSDEAYDLGLDYDAFCEYRNRTQEYGGEYVCDILYGEKWRDYIPDEKSWVLKALKFFEFTYTFKVLYIIDFLPGNNRRKVGTIKMEIKEGREKDFRKFLAKLYDLDIKDIWRNKDYEFDTAEEILETVVEAIKSMEKDFIEEYRRWLDFFVWGVKNGFEFEEV